MEEEIKLKVGKHYFTTTLSILTKQPNSMLARMFSGEFKINKDNDGNVLIHRDGTYFHYILQFLSSSTTSLPTTFDSWFTDETHFSLFLNELDYYCLDFHPEYLFDKDCEYILKAEPNFLKSNDQNWKTTYLTPVVYRRASVKFMIKLESSYCSWFGVVDAAGGDGIMQKKEWLGELGGYGFGGHSSRDVMQVYGRKGERGDAEGINFRKGDVIGLDVDLENQTLTLTKEGQSCTIHCPFRRAKIACSICGEACYELLVDKNDPKV